jgi:hypothetical protein
MERIAMQRTRSQNFTMVHAPVNDQEERRIEGDDGPGTFFSVVFGDFFRGSFIQWRRAPWRLGGESKKSSDGYKYLIDRSDG